MGAAGDTPDAAAPPTLQLARHFPMLVMRMDDLLELSEIPIHEEAEGLIEHKPGMDGEVIFVSHTWLTRGHPDRDGLKLGLLKSLIRSVRAGRLDVDGTVIKYSWYGSKVRVKAAELARCKYIWFDLFSVPQRDAASQAKAIQSIFSYVHDAAQFVCLAGAWEHEGGHLCDCRSWMKRGWCRLEMLANALSPRVKNVILMESSTSITSHGPSGLFGQQWFTSPVGAGDFTVDADRLALGGVIAAMLESRKALALEQGDLLTYSFVHAVSAYTLSGSGTAAPQEASLAEWMAAMRFESVREGAKTGWTPLMFAVVAGRADICEALLDAGASPTTRMRRMYPQYALRKSTPLLHVACLLRDVPDIVRLLIARGADPMARMPGMPHKPLAHQAAGFGHVGNIDVLAELSPACLHQRDLFGFTFMMSVAYAHDLNEGTAAHVLSAHRHLIPDQTGPEWGASLLGLALEEAGGEGTLTALLDHGYDPDGPLDAQIKPWTAKLMCWGIFRCPVTFADEPMLEMKFTLLAPPLFMACNRGNVAAVRLLLARGADPTSVARLNPRRHTALHVAAWRGHELCCRALLEAGAKRSAVDRYGKNAAAWALRAGHAELARQLAA